MTGRYRDHHPRLPSPPPERIEPPPERPAWQLLLIPMLVGGLVALTLGVYGNVHDGTGVAVNLAGFQNHPAPTSAVKVTLSTGALGFAVLQILTALIMYGKVPGVAAADWSGTAHRWSGRLAFLCAVPVGIHCLYAAGFQSYDGRIFLHSLVGCLFFGAFTVKMLGLRKDGMPGWFLPVLGGSLFTGLVAVWWTTAIRFFENFGSPI
ncbi:hypothetical protein JQS43_14850 [Natronosporangium hydrolyticum]|uniref:Uncharacterized protein n=2 Tax=Natronosporangium hydrolyticum TaxID=2811111 RepID=A0A895YMZ4_9ACTN|nr:hypothetical protein JQS43_14850 [Natronosporangium hydrolyticum]